MSNTTEKTPDSPDLTSTRGGVGLASDALFDATVTETQAAIAIFNRCHTLIRDRLGSNLADHLTEQSGYPEDGSEEGQIRLQGFKQGRELALSLNSKSSDDYKVTDVLDAVYGKKDSSNVRSSTPRNH